MRRKQEQPLDAQIRAREAFIERSWKRIAFYDEERAAEVSRLEESEKRLEELRAMQRAQPGLPSTPVADASTEVTRLQQMVMGLQKQLHQGQHATGSPAVVSPFRIRKREGYVPATEQEVMEWTPTGGHECSAPVWASFRSGAHLRFDHRGHEKSPACCCFPVHGDQRGEVMGVPRRTESRYGLRHQGGRSIQPSKVVVKEGSQAPQPGQRGTV